MKAQEKELIYNLLKAADAYNSGYTRANFLQNFEFLDDDEGSISKEVTLRNIKRILSTGIDISLYKETGYGNF